MMQHHIDSSQRRRIVSVTQGVVTLYDADDRSCSPTLVSAGQGFVEPGNHVHIPRNEGNIEARWTTTAVRPTGLVCGHLKMKTITQAGLTSFPDF
jgi:hypothetical protein